ncbi:DDB1- and CUL4-associated factor 12-like protein 2 [Cavia porcellus]|uniref:DDB1- and CUL4-associated factor 12-like protein 2 n=1 Tax=Cavia porcellus TaxID=10141 RepID=UPI000350B20F|nr:DDB1- and CUL4-associated factor 12-like protein 2 [Cavia porcellus]
MATCLGASDQPSLGRGSRDSSFRSVTVPQQEGFRTERGVPRSWTQAGPSGRSSHTLRLQEQEQAGSRSLVHYLQHRALGMRGRPSLQGVRGQMGCRLASQLPELLTERRLHLGAVDKVFSSQWLNDRQVVCGTKCNTLFMVDVHSDHVTPIPLLQDRRPRWYRVHPASGIRAIELNPSKTLLATGGENSNSLAVYQLPMLDPVCVGDRRGHRDSITSMAWISDAAVVSGSWDGSLAVWEVDPDRLTGSTACSSEAKVPPYAHIRPRNKELIPGSSIHYGNSKVQAVAFGGKRQELAAVSLDGYFHLWKAQSTLTRLQSFSLPFDQENTCLSYSEELSLYAVGSQSHVCLLDLRKGHPNIGVRPVCNIEDGIGVCSMSFHQHIITMGTGHSCLIFFDIRKRRFLEEMSATSPESLFEPTGRKLRLSCSKHWADQDDHWMNYYPSIQDIPYGIYTHCYNWPEMKLFMGGGPLASELRGSYAGLWS